MASGLLLLLDDVVTYLDDVAVMAKLGAKKASVVASDDVALNANQVVGAPSDQELPLIAKVAVGGFKNKAILIVIALMLSAWLPFLITPLLMLGGAYLCFEGMEKLIHWRDAKKEVQAIDLDQKIKGAIRTDFILSAEIIIISLGAISAASFATKVTSLIVIGFSMNILIYGLVAFIVKIDDAGFWFTKKENKVAKNFGFFLLWLAPWILKVLSVLGTAAMFLVGGGILAHNKYAESLTQALNPYVGSFDITIVNAMVGLVAGLILVGIVKGVEKLRHAKV